MIYDFIAVMFIVLTIVGLVAPLIAGPKSKDRF